MAVGARGRGVDLQPAFVAMVGAESGSGRGAGDALHLRDHRDGGVGDPCGIFKTLGLFRRDPISDLRFDPRRQ